MKVLAAMSGGVDSACAALTLLEQGHQVAGVTMRLYGADETAAAAQVCGSIGIPHHVLDLRQEFETEIIDYFAKEYAAGNTPNPCVKCNLKIKFGRLYRYAMDNGFDAIATGHYARIEQAGGRYRVKKASDPLKDQSYVMYNLKPEMLPHILFPLGEMTKADTRALAQMHSLPNSSTAESQDICFLPNGGHGEFICGRLKTDFPQGDFVLSDGTVLGKHKGIIHYTIGQRKGLGVSHAHPLFVLEKDVQNNKVILGSHDELLKKEVFVTDINWVSGGETLPLDCAVRTRYHQKETAATVHLWENGVRAVFEQGIRAPAPGQSAVFYSGDILLGGGIIQ